MARSGPNGPTLSTIQALAIASQFGITLAVSVGLGLFVGQWLDGVAHTSIVFTLIGVLLGLVAAAASGVTLYRSAMRKGGFETSASPTARKIDAPDDDATL